VWSCIGAHLENIPHKVNVNYIRIPPTNNKIVMVADPILATVNTILNEIKNRCNPKRLILLNVIGFRRRNKKHVFIIPILRFTLAQSMLK